MTEPAQAARPASLPSRWRRALQTGNPPPGPVDPVTRWLVLTRAAVLPMTLTAAAVAGLLAVGRPGFRWPLWGLATLGLVSAHVANNLMNDLFDLQAGTDTADYPRALYAPHPVLSGLATRGQLVRAALVANVVDLVVLQALPVPALLALGGLRRFVLVRRAYLRPRPAQPPDGFPVWPLWFAPLAFVHARRAGSLFVAGLAVGVLFR